MLQYYGESLNQNHPKKDVNRQYVEHFIHKFHTTGLVNNMRREVKCPVRNEGIEVSVFCHLHMDPTQSVRKITEVSGVSCSSVHRILKTSQFHPYKITQVQEVNEDDPGARLQVCEPFLK